ncbi:2TM domain-containing protein [Flavobacterium sp. 7A]|uniref:2TM domain-containing protein n=1 Tax=Flavobacterium sp. 7A TaxID=2940571 RepID=UPI002225E701|nr:2TM domain-containing protein [Flavobacterium sp. 7A]MCW2119704.1 hypothetical protein [Flavobacterium sp. 7A]
MEYSNQEEERYYRARKKVEDIKGFYGNLTSYVVVNSGLFILNVITSPGHYWFYWPLLGWGIGVLFHACKVFDLISVFGYDWEERKIKEFMEKENQNQKRDQWQ